MALTEVKINDKIEVVTTGTGDWSSVQVRKATIIMRDGVEIARSYERHVVMPDADLTGEDADVQEICAASFTPSRKAAFAASKPATRTAEVEETAEVVEPG